MLNVKDNFKTRVTMSPPTKAFIVLKKKNIKSTADLDFDLRFAQDESASLSKVSYLRFKAKRLAGAGANGVRLIELQNVFCSKMQTNCRPIGQASVLF